jgi:WD40 repeat protein
LNGGEAVAEVFISYSRTDKEFVRKLYDSLTRLDREAWIDWEGIPVTAEWLKEIYAGIEQADNFIFVISPESVSSATCRQEIEYAAENHKRLIPILYRSVPDNALPKAIGTINFIFMRETDAFDSAFALLIHSLDTDLDWTRAHTRLLVRAKEWEREQKDRSFLLTGKDLREAEIWQSRAGSQEPKPTTLHAQYILASRQAETRRARRTLAAVAVALVLTVGLAVAAWVQRNTARQQAAIALGRQFTLQSSSLLDKRLDLALLLSLQAESINHSFEARSALFSALQHSPRLLAFLRSSGNPAPGAKPARVSGLAVSLDGKWVAATGGMEQPTLALWHADTHQPAGKPLVGHTGPVYSVAFSPDSQTLVSGGQDNAVIFWNTATQRLLARLSGHSGGVSSLAFSSDGKTVASGDASNLVLLWDAVTRTRLGEIKSPSLRLIQSLNFLPGGKLALTGFAAKDSNDQITELWDVQTDQRVGEPFPKKVLAFTSDGLVAATGGQDGKSIDVLETATRKIIKTLKGDFNLFTGAAAFSPDNKILAIGNGNAVELWIPSGKRVASLQAHQEFVDAIAFFPNGKTLASLGWDDAVILWDAINDRSLARPFASGDAGLLAFSPDGKALASAQEDGVVLREIAGAKEVARYPEPVSAVIGSMAFNPQGNILVVSGTSSKEEADAHLINLAHNDLRIPPATLTRASQLAIDAAGANLAIGFKDGRISVWDLTQHRERWYASLASGGTAVTALSFSPKGNVLASAQASGAMSMWDAATGSRLAESPQPFNTPGEQPFVISFTSDGGTLAVTAHEMMSLWDVPSRRRVNFFSTGSGVGAPLLALFNPESGLLAWGTIFSASSEIHLMDSRARQQFGPPLHNPTDAGQQALTGLAFSPDARTLAASYRHWDSARSAWIGDGIVLWDFDLDSWRRQACAIANRNFTAEERDQYFGGLPPGIPCPVQAH